MCIYYNISVKLLLYQETGYSRKLAISVPVSGNWLYQESGCIRNLIISGNWLYQESGYIRKIVIAGNWLYQESVYIR